MQCCVLWCVLLFGQEQGVISQQQLREGLKKQAQSGAVDPSTLPEEEQLLQIIRLLSKNTLVCLGLLCCLSSRG